MPGATYSPQMIEKPDSTSLALATIAILGQAPRSPVGLRNNLLRNILHMESRLEKGSSPDRVCHFGLV